MKRVRENPGEELSPQAKRLLGLARPLRVMTPVEKAHTQAFVASLAKRSPLWLHFELGTSQRIAVVLTALCMFLGIKLHTHRVNNVSTPMVIVADARLRAETDHIELASIPRALTTQTDLPRIGNAPGYGDICGQHVCESMPSCCEGNWDETCDQKLLELTRLPSGQASMNTGRCYWHDREDCPGCACPAYLKRIEVFPLGDEGGVSLGYDGVTGCMRSTESLLANLKWMCVELYCEV